MKKILRSLLLVLVVLFLFGCKAETLEGEVKIIVPQGNPYIAVGDLVGEENIIIDSVNGAAGVQSALVSNDYDIIIAPLNLGAKLYSNEKSKYVLDSVIALGNTYIISKEGVKLDVLEDLQDKTILAYSKGGTPDIILQYVLKDHNINVTIEYQSSLTEVVPLFVQGKYDYILAAEPVITNLQVKKNINLNILNLQNYTENTIMQAAIFVNPDSNQKLIDKVIEKIEMNIKNMNDNPTQYAQNIISKDVYFSDLGVDILSRSIPNSNLDFVNASNNKDKVEQYLRMINYELPKEEFYRK